MLVLRGGGLYFALVFGAGVVLGSIRVLWLVPRLGERMAEMMEAPIMLAVVVLGARWVTRRLAVPPARLPRLGVGLVALGLLLIAEFTMVLWLRGLTLGEYLASRDPTAGAAYAIMLGLFAIMPCLVRRRTTP